MYVFLDSLFEILGIDLRHDHSPYLTITLNHSDNRGFVGNRTKAALAAPNPGLWFPAHIGFINFGDTVKVAPV